ncbi:hypothetical protein [Streptosporangium vulgare]|uniref:hypothetical protein n=1 Tax=Streptosporangium vulgare TaxID=46190 RepID=UPI0031CE869F
MRWGRRCWSWPGGTADGALPLCLPPRQVLNAMEQIGRGAAAGGRTLPSWTSPRVRLVLAGRGP